MKCLIISLILCCSITIWSTSAQKHDLYSGNCAPDNNAVEIYTQVVAMKNPQPGLAQKPPERPHRWYDIFTRFSFRRQATVHQPHNSGPILEVKIVFPPEVRIHTFIIHL